MVERRFTVKRRRVPLGPAPRTNVPRISQWAVCDKNRRITVGFHYYGEAERKRDNIQVIYAKYGW